MIDVDDVIILFILTTLVWDKIVFIEEIILDKETTHNTSGIIVQTLSKPEAVKHDVYFSLPKRQFYVYNRSIDIYSYQQKKRTGPTFSCFFALALEKYCKNPDVFSQGSTKGLFAIYCLLYDLDDSGQLAPSPTIFLYKLYTK